MFGGVEPAAARLPREALWVAVTIGVNVGVGKRIVRGHRAVGIQTQNFAVERTQILSVASRLRVARGPVELAVGAEFHSAAVMVVGAGNFVDQRLVKYSLGGLGIFAQAHESVAQRKCAGAVAIGNVDVEVFCKLRIESEAEKAGFAPGGDLNRHPWLGEKPAFFDDANPPLPFADESSPVRREIDGPGRVEPAGER